MTGEIEIVVEESKETECVGKRKKENSHQYSRFIDRPTIGQKLTKFCHDLLKNIY